MYGAVGTYGRSFGVFGLIAALTALAVSSDPADARRGHRSHGHHRQVETIRYSPPYSSLVLDVNSGKVMQQTSPDAARHPASLTKIMTLYLLFERLDAGKIRLDTPLTVSAHAAAQPPSKLGLKPGQTIEVEDAIKAVVTRSANDIAVVIGEALGGNESDFAAMMTRKARALGMSRTTYRNASGLPDEDQVTTARDQATLAVALQERFPRYYRYFSTESFRYRNQVIRNHNHLLGHIEGVDGIKTGYIRESGFNLVTSVRRGNRHIVSVIFGGRSASQRDAQMRELIGDNIAVAATKHTAPVIAENTESATPALATATIPVPVARTHVASAIEALPAEQMLAAAVPAPRPGSTAPLKPRLVKTIEVRRNVPDVAAKSASTPAVAAKAFAVASAALAPINPAVAATAAQALAPSQPEPLLPPAGTRPGVLPVHVAGVDATAPLPAPRSAEPTTHHTTHGGWLIQVGAFEQESDAKQRLNAAKAKAARLLAAADPFTERYAKGAKTYYRARFAGLDKEQAEAACRYLKRNEVVCMVAKD